MKQLKQKSRSKFWTSIPKMSISRQNYIRKFRLRKIVEANQLFQQQYQKLKSERIAASRKKRQLRRKLRQEGKVEQTFQEEGANRKKRVVFDEDSNEEHLYEMWIANDENWQNGQSKEDRWDESEESQEESAEEEEYEQKKKIKKKAKPRPRKLAKKEEPEPQPSPQPQQQSQELIESKMMNSMWWAKEDETPLILD